MKATDLMIGDWIKGESNIVARVIEIKEYLIRIDAGIGRGVFEPKELFPIPITPEILEKNGYKRIKGGKVMGLHVADIFDLEISNEYGRYLKIDLQDFGETEATHWYIGIQGKFSFSGYIGYLHQLQHIYRLCGIEKEIIISSNKEK